MLDLGFSEMMVIAVVALVVLGPERLPKVARTLGQWVGRMQRYVSDVKADINREMELEELRRFRQTVEEAASSVQSGLSGLQSSARATGNELSSLVSGEPAPTSPQSAAPSSSPPSAWETQAPDTLAAQAGDFGASGVSEGFDTVASAMGSPARAALYVAPISLAMSSEAESARGEARSIAPSPQVHPDPLAGAQA